MKNGILTRVNVDQVKPCYYVAPQHRQGMNDSDLEELRRRARQQVRAIRPAPVIDPQPDIQQPELQQQPAHIQSEHESERTEPAVDAAAVNNEEQPEVNLMDAPVPEIPKQFVQPRVVLEPIDQLLAEQARLRTARQQQEQQQQQYVTRYGRVTRQVQNNLLNAINDRNRQSMETSDDDLIQL